MSMTDRELLELAAKAAGLTVIAHHQAARDAAGFGHVGLYVDGDTAWNPLTDDGDALRLAVGLGLQVLCPDAEPTVVVKFYPWGDAQRFVECAGTQDPNAATRRAIVRAAAAIGSAA